MTRQEAVQKELFLCSNCFDNGKVECDCNLRDPLLEDMNKPWLHGTLSKEDMDWLWRVICNYHSMNFSPHDVSKYHELLDKLSAREREELDAYVEGLRSGLRAGSAALCNWVEIEFREIRRKYAPSKKIKWREWL